MFSYFVWFNSISDSNTWVELIMFLPGSTFPEVDDREYVYIERSVQVPVSAIERVVLEHVTNYKFSLTSFELEELDDSVSVNNS